MSVEELKSKIRQACENQGVRRLDLFGSKARTNAMEGNDFDFLATFEDSAPSEYSRRFFNLLHSLEDILDEPVDLLTIDSIHKRSLKKRIEEEKICVYGS